MVCTRKVAQYRHEVGNGLLFISFDGLDNLSDFVVNVVVVVGSVMVADVVSGLFATAIRVKNLVCAMLRCSCKCQSWVLGMEYWGNDGDRRRLVWHCQS